MWWFAVLVLGVALGVAAGWKLREKTAAADPAATAEAELGVIGGRDGRLLRIVEALPLGVVVFNEAGDQVFTSDVAAQLSSDRLHHALIRSAMADVVAEASEGRIAQKMLELYGSPRTYLSIRGVPVGAAIAGKAAVVVTIEDTTDVRSADLLRRDFVANVSHELKTPIGAISVLAETLLDVDDPDVAKRLAGRLQSESLRLATTVDDLLTLARIESGEQMRVVDVPVVDLFTAVANRLAVQSEERSIALDFVVEPSGLVVRGDRVQLISGIGNLVDNAVKYSEHGSTVVVTASASGAPDSGVVLSIEDEGIGIPESDLDRIFERFYRVDRGRGRDTGGTGLGLSIVRHVVRNHNGTIKVTSEEGVGTTFVMALPSSPDQHAATNPPTPEKARS